MFLPIQKAAIAALEGPLDSVKEQCRQYQARRDALCDGLASIGWEKPNGKGTMFVWAKLPGKRTDSMAFCMELMEKAGVIVTPGASFRSSWGRICALRAGTSTRENQRGCGIYPYKWNLSTTSKFIFKYIASFNKPYTTRFARYGSNRQKLTQTSALGFD